ncbi:VOC family protein [Ruania zhangjianzhongii]|uniref:VOC family protein n=1 Tax=Ruania zhangjianzhongii TaxID=2603206 RepID=UPI0011C797AA|nr:VOC family protein [Ruania zhangjianzhongii]
MTAPLTQRDALAQDTAMGVVDLLAGDLDTMVAYYTDGVGLDLISMANGTATLGRGSTPIMRLEQRTHLPQFDRGSAGLYHTAILFADQAGLAASVNQMAGYAPRSYTGAADHLVSEAFYFDDPEGNGVELYVDRPRQQWTRTAGGGVEMSSLPLDPNQFVLRHLDRNRSADSPAPQAEIGHVHLQVGSIATAEAFYVDTLGFDVMNRFGSQALFVAAGGYHHHIGMNTWHSAGAGPRAASLGLGQLTIELPNGDDLEALTGRLTTAGVPVRTEDSAIRFEDPWKTQIEVRATA